MHKYHTEDLTRCFRDQKIVFVGDSVTRQIFWATARKLGSQGPSDEDPHLDQYLGFNGVTLEFVWDPYMNSTALNREISAATLPEDGSEIAGTTAILLIGGGLWHARYVEEYYPSFQNSISLISRNTHLHDGKMLELRSSASASNHLIAESFKTLIAFAPVPVPAYDSLSHARAETITPEKVDTMNSYLHKVSIESQLPVAWSFTSMTAKERRAYASDGLHVTEQVASSMADVLFNARCNLVLRQSQAKAYPMDKTCCNGYEPPNWVQAMILNLSMGLLPLLTLVTRRSPANVPFLPPLKVTRAITVLALAICYCYYADRTHLFNKAQKQFSSQEFMNLCVITFALGVLSIRRSKTAPKHEGEAQSSQVRDQPFLSREQTDEWKGWMQMVILIYHYTGASKISWIYQIIRLLVASYLFMSGFGHTIFFCKRADFSLQRCAAVLIRLNLLSCILPYVMGTEYIFYYFAPLISLWYLVIYCTMAFGRGRNSSLAFLVPKILISATLVNFFIRYPGIFEGLFYFLEKLFKIHWDVNEWRFRLQLDSFVVYVGMLCAVIFIKSSDALQGNTYGKNYLEKLFQVHFNHIRMTLAMVAILVCPYFFAFARNISSKQEYNGWVPYVSALPIISFVILRNFSRHARNFHSSIFAWVGRHSLETFTLQFHIWLAADTKGLLAIGILERATGDAIDGRVFDMIVLTIIFLWVCWHVASATQIVTNWIIDPLDEKESLDAHQGFGRERIDLLDTPSNIMDRKHSTGIGRYYQRAAFGASKLANGAKRIIAERLEARLALIFAVMWVLNLVYAL